MDEKARELLQAPNFAHVATTRTDGSPYSVLVWVDVEDERVVLNSAEGRDWVANVRRDPRVELLVPNQANPYEYVRIRGRVAEEDKDDAKAHIDRMAKKYMGQDEYPFLQPGEVRVKFMVEPEKVDVRSAG